MVSVWSSPDRPAYPHQALAVVLQVRERRLHAMLWQRPNEPFAGAWALPGGPLRPDETLGASVARQLAEAGLEVQRYLPNGRPKLDSAAKLPWFLLRWAALLFSRAVWRSIYVGELGRPGLTMPLDRDLLVIAVPRSR